MLIGELSRKTGLSKDTIRYYAKLGLIGLNDQRSDNNYRQYDDETVEHLLFIKQGKMMGFTLSEMKTIIDDWHTGGITQAQKIEAVRSKIGQVETQMEQLQTFKRYLVAKLEKLQSGQENTCPVTVQGGVQS